MKNFATLLLLATAVFCLSAQGEAAQKKKTAPPAAKTKVNPYELCKQLVAKSKGSHIRVQRYRITKDGTLHCWYYA